MDQIINLLRTLEEKENMDDHIKKLNEYGKLGLWKYGSFGLAVKKIFAEHFNVTLEFIEEWKVKIHGPGRGSRYTSLLMKEHRKSLQE